MSEKCTQDLQSEIEELHREIDSLRLESHDIDRDYNHAMTMLSSIVNSDKQHRKLIMEYGPNNPAVSCESEIFCRLMVKAREMVKGYETPLGVEIDKQV